MLPPATGRKECPMCNKIGLVEEVEKLPGDGVLYKCAHDDGRECEWGFRDNIEAMRTAKTDHLRQEIECPECNEIGLITAERDESDITKPDNWKYFLSHPNGSRCLVMPQNRHVVLKATGRYITKEERHSDKTISDNAGTAKGKRERRQRSHRALIECPKPGCHKMGKAQFRIDKNPAVIHSNVDGFGHDTWHYMDTKELKDLFVARTGQTLKLEPEQKQNRATPRTRNPAYIRNQNKELRTLLAERDRYIDNLHEKIKSLAGCVGTRFGDHILPHVEESAS